MADESNTNPTTDAAVTDAPAMPPAPKKQRATPRPKAATDMMRGLTVAKPPRGRPKRSELAADATLTSAETPFAGKRSAKGVVKEGGRKRRSKRADAVTTPVAAMDEMADLIQLEEENKRLRKTLAEKLRAENADLRKRLGLN
jgi:putative transposase